jgi:signal transduction histidine kinase
LGYGPWVEEVWVNYLSNGIQNGGHPPILELGGSAAPAGMARFWVRDHGEGIAPAEQASLFSPFAKLHQVCTAGYGLGLPVAKHIVEKLGGQVGLVSQQGEGSTFYFTLPAFGTAGAV